MATRPPAPPIDVLSFRIFGQSVQVSCTEATLSSVILVKFAALHRQSDAHPDLQYLVTANVPEGVFSLTRPGRPAVTGEIGDLLYHLEKDITVAVQERRPDLLFLHAAALEYGGKTFLLTGASGSGKSTTAWGLLQHGFRYLSDELSPIVLDAMAVLPYPHALGMKRPPPEPYPLPSSGVLESGGIIHVSAGSLPTADPFEPCELGAIFFVRYDESLSVSVLRKIGPAEAGARLYLTVLNALAHSSRGLDAVVSVVQRVAA